MTPFEEEQMDALKRQVERLRQESDALNRGLGAAVDEVERLTIERDEARKDGTRLLAEVKGLRKFVEEQTELGRQ